MFNWISNVPFLCGGWRAEITSSGNIRPVTQHFENLYTSSAWDVHGMHPTMVISRKVQFIAVHASVSTATKTQTMEELKLNSHFTNNNNWKFRITIRPLAFINNCRSSIHHCIYILLQYFFQFNSPHFSCSRFFWLCSPTSQRDTQHQFSSDNPPSKLDRN